MRGQLACALGALALAWFSGKGQAQDVFVPPLPAPAATIISTLDDGKPGGKTEKLEAPMMVLDPGACDGHGRGCRWHWEVGGGFYFIQPNFESNTAFVTRRTTGVTTTNTTTDFRYNLEVTPLAWIAWTHDCGLGVRGRWFMFDNGVSANINNDGTQSIASNAGVSSANGDRLTNTHNLELQVGDLEMTHLWRCGQWNFLVAAGVRYTFMEQTRDAAIDFATGARFTDNAVNKFSGAGPAFALESRRRLGDSGLSVYGNGRLSILFGTSQTDSTFNVVNAQGIVTSNVVSNFSHDDTLSIGEAEVGVQWGRDCGRARIFAQTGFIGQMWWGGGNAASTTNNFGLVGGVVRFGINF